MWEGADHSITSRPGVLGPSTRHAILVYQRTKKIPATGQLDAVTMAHFMQDAEEAIAGTAHPAQ